jgi:hypothetical protein
MPDPVHVSSFLFRCFGGIWRALEPWEGSVWREKRVFTESISQRLDKHTGYIVETQEYSFIQLFADLGAVWGMYLGIAFATVVELIDLACTMHLVGMCFQRYWGTK